MNWIMENMGILGAIAAPLLSLIIGILLKKMSMKKKKILFKLIEIVREELIKADVEGDNSIVSNDHVNEKLDKLKIDLGLGKLPSEKKDSN